MNYPTPAQITAWAKATADTDWKGLAHRLGVVISRDKRGGSNEVDGYRTAVMQFGSGPRGNSELTATEANAVARMKGKTDEMRLLVQRAIGHFQDIVTNVGALTHVLDTLEARAKPVIEEDDRRWCVSCIRDGGYLTVVAAGRYARYCTWCGEFRYARGIEPPLEILKARHDGKRLSTAMVDRALRRAG